MLKWLNCFSFYWILSSFAEADVTRLSFAISGTKLLICINKKSGSSRKIQQNVGRSVKKHQKARRTEAQHVLAGPYIPQIL